MAHYPGPGMRRAPQPALIVVILLACAVVGLAAGLGARQIVNGVAFTTPPAHATNTTNPQQARATDTPAATATPDSVATVIPPSGFVLSLTSVSPHSVAAGQQFTVTVTALAPDGVTPLAGVLCTIGPPQDGGQPLYQQWPAPAVSNAQGEAIWTLQAPTISAGTYGMAITAYGAGGWHYHVDASLTITG